MATKSQFILAVDLIHNYLSNIPHPTAKSKKSTEDVGARVKLSAFGKKMQKPKASLTGTVISYRQFLTHKGDGIVTVLWDGKAKPSEMHLSQIETVLTTKTK